MKKTKIAMVAVFLLALSSSCKKDKTELLKRAQPEVTQESLQIKTEVVTDPKVVAMLKEIVHKTRTGRMPYPQPEPVEEPNYSTVTFKEDYPIKETQPGVSGCVYIMNQVGMNAANPENYSLCLYFDSLGNNKATNIIGTRTQGAKRYAITYSWAWQLLQELEYDTITKKIEDLTPRYSAPTKGQAAMDCISDAYQNHGVTSIWLTVQSAFIPPTLAAVSLSCVMINFWPW